MIGLNGQLQPVMTEQSDEARALERVIAGLETVERIETM
ncbi:hypothetical protein C7450_101521 [Chelatococcus asaccharovorans]|uniref:Uncharacterized protein n=1 Tax=Chelatococcus asaccharovorans TaxID=28210 RepID=A0A2V3UHC4_9HYPH|nr:hypothetical protein C7450_101521 [Chelatococcus asaccharovorans]